MVYRALCFTLQLNDAGSGLQLNDDPDLKLSPLGW